MVTSTSPMPPSLQFLAFLLLLLLSTNCSPATCDDKPPARPLQTYIVHVHKPPPGHTGTHREWHESFMPCGTDGSTSSSRMVYSYGHVFSGFAARLTEEDLAAMRKKDGFLHAEPNRLRTLDTTHTPAFLGLHQSPGSFWTNAGYGKGTIIGMLDTGITPNHPSFNDRGMPPPPSRWNGTCDLAPPSRCNNKLIGARVFELSGEDHGDTNTLYSNDEDGHGTHTSATAAGRFVTSASLLGNAKGTAAGVAPEAHLAMYRVCDIVGCYDADIIAAIESAVRDGVDVISMSISGAPTDFYSDSIAIAAFGAMKKGVLFTASAGNTGPSSGTVRNLAPWMMTVGASTVDRRIRSIVRLGNGAEYEGESAYQRSSFSPNKLLPLVHPQSPEDELAKYCSNETTLRQVGVKNKAVVCLGGEVDTVEKGKIVKKAGGAAMIVMNPVGYDTFAEAHFLPASYVSFASGSSILEYINSTSNPTASIVFKGTDIGGSSDPAVGSFSSRGPSSVTPGVLKPDIVGPGVNVLAAWPSPVGPFSLSPAFNILSGTSMSTPHLSGVVALLKGQHPDWTPAMIKSAIMTTADITNLKGDPIIEQWKNKQASFYEMGAGHVNPARANDPGLVYDLKADDYLAYLCGIGFTDEQVTIVNHRKTNCSRYKKTGEANLNYPSFEVPFSNSTATKSSRVVSRTVTNVGKPTTYKVQVVPPPGVTMTVQPESLAFMKAGQKATFTVSFALNMKEIKASTSSFSASEGSLTWVSSDGITKVRSPVVVTLGSFSSAPQLTAGGSSELTLD